MIEPATTLNKPPPLIRKWRLPFNGDPIMHVLVGLCALLLFVVVAMICYELVRHSLPSIKAFGWRFLISKSWNPVTENFGALSSIFGTVVSTFIALVVAVPLSLIIALFLVELAPPRLAAVVGGAIELLAAIPSIIYGMWGMFVFAPIMADYVQPALAKVFPGLPLFAGPPMGLGMLTAGLILALMILPYVTSITRDVFRMTPPVLREAALGMGSTTWEATRRVTLPHGLRGVAGGVLLGLGRALGETMAVTFVIGNSHRISGSLFAAGNTISSTLANEFAEADAEIYLSSLIELGLVLFVITLVVQGLGQLWLRSLLKNSGGGR